MDPATVAGLVGTIIGFYSNCRDCYIFFTDLKNADKDARVQARELGIQESILKACGQYWEITRHQELTATNKDTIKLDQTDPPNQKITQYLKSNHFKTQGIANALFCIAETLSNQEKLKEKYGLQLDVNGSSGTVNPGAIRETGFPELESEPASVSSDSTAFFNSLRKKAAVLRSRLHLFKRCRWVLIDGAKVKTLIGDLKQHNDSLYRLCPEGAVETLHLRFVMEYLSGHNLVQLKNMVSQVSTTLISANKTPDQLAHDVQSPTQQALGILVDVAGIKLQAQMARSSTKPLRPHQEAELLNFQPEDLKQGENGMAVWLSKRQAVYVDDVIYSTGDVKVRENILKLGWLLRNPLCAKHLDTMELLGMVEYSDPWEGRLGYVYKLPGALGKSKKGFPAEDLLIRRPRSLFVYRDGDVYPSLGWRFNLARKLVRGVIFLHACGWLHKNIRSENVRFFPKSHQAQIDRSHQEIDFESPFMLGYQYSRPDDLISPATARKHHLSRAKAPHESMGLPSQIQSSHPEANVSLRRRVTINEAVDDNTNSDNEEYENREGVYSAKDEPRDDPRVQYSEETRDQTRDEPRVRYREIKDPRDRETHTRYVDRIELDLRHHPAKRANPNIAYCHAFDVYSLGILLLEIGVWTPLENLVKEIDKKGPELDPYEVRRLIIRQNRNLLKLMCGDIYERVTTACLEVDREDSTEDLEQQRQLCLKVVEGLAQCHA